MVELALPSDRLVIRAMRAGDAEGLARYRSDPEVARYQSWDAPYPVAAARAFLAEQAAEQVAAERVAGALLAPGGWRQLAICRRADGVLLGDCAVHPLVEDARIVEIGFSLATEYQHRGFAAEAVTRLLVFLFDERRPERTHRVIAGCDVRNTGSARLLERVGMRREAHLVESEWFKEEWISEYRYAILRREWSPAG